MSPTGRSEFPSAFEQLPALQVSERWSEVLHGEAKRDFERLLPDFLMQRRWFGSKGRQIISVKIAETVPIPHDGTESFLALIELGYQQGNGDAYLLGLSFVGAKEAERTLGMEPSAAVLRLVTTEGEGIVYDAVRDKGFVMALLDSIDRESRFPSEEGQVAATRTGKFGQLRSEMTEGADPRVMGVEQSNTSIVFGERLILKLFRRVESGVNPDLELGRFLTDHGFFNTPPVAGALEMSPVRDEEEPRTLGILQGFVPNRGDAWKYTLENLAESLKEVEPHEEEMFALPVPDQSPLLLANQQPPALLTRVSGDYLQAVKLLGQRTAEMHVTLDSDRRDPSFAPEPFSSEYQRGVHGSMRRLANGVLAMLRQHMAKLPSDVRAQAEQLLRQENEVLDIYQTVLEVIFDAERTRIHGDYHLGQVLFTGNDFVIIDFEGEPARPIKERRIKRSPLRDVAGMLRSFDYAGQSAVLNLRESSKKAMVERFSALWVPWVSAAFLNSYLQTAREARFLPADPQEIEVMLDVFLLEKAVYEIGYELNNRPAWVAIPIGGILQILRGREQRKDLARRVA